jgi:hypothetical protein
MATEPLMFDVRVSFVTLLLISMFFPSQFFSILSQFGSDNGGESGQYISNEFLAMAMR